MGLLLTLILNLFTIAARSGLRNANLARVSQIRDEIGAQGDRALTLMSSTTRSYAGLHFFQAFCRLLLIGLLLQLILIGNESWTVGWRILTLLLAGFLIAILEWVVERLAVQEPEGWVIRLGFFIQALTFLFYPFISLSLLLSKDNTLSQEPNIFVTEEELKLMVEAGQQEGVLEQEEGQMIFSIFQLGDTLTREIMVPRIEMLALEVNTPLSQAIDTFLDSGYSRVPVYKGRVDNIIGIFYAKDLLKVQREGNGADQSIRSLLRDPYFVPEAKKADELLAEMQLRRVHMAIVVDEYGGVAGVVTLEDIIEEILGEIQDEYDVEDMPFQLLDDGSYLFRGRIDIDDFNQITDSSLPPEEADTLSGFIYGRLGHVPVAGESVRVGKLVLSVEQVSNRRIRTVRARLDSSEGKQDVN
jgi:CBS domain containing-hemolysin-like protein